MNRDPLPQRRLVIDAVIHGVFHEGGFVTITWCGQTGPVETRWSTELTCLLCIAVGEPVWNPYYVSSMSTLHTGYILTPASEQ